jgi:hypothetical protein
MVVKNMKINKILGENDLYYILFQTAINIVILYMFVLFLTDFTSEFQVTISGGYFIAIFYGIQSNYIFMLKDYMTKLIY